MNPIAKYFMVASVVHDIVISPLIKGVGTFAWDLGNRVFLSAFCIVCLPENHDTGSENLAPVPPSNTTSNALDPFCLTPPKYDTLSPALAGTSPSLADFECSPMHGSLLTSVLDAAAAAAASSGVEMQPESSLASSLTGGNALFVNETSQGNALGYASCGQNGRSSTSTVPSSGPQPSRASCHARSLNFDTAPSKEVTDTLSFVQRNAISVFPPVDAVVTSIPSSTSAAASPSSLLVAANQPLPSLASGDAVSPSQAADGDSVHSSYGVSWQSVPECMRCLDGACN